MIDLGPRLDRILDGGTPGQDDLDALDAFAGDPWPAVAGTGARLDLLLRAKDGIRAAWDRSATGMPLPGSILWRLALPLALVLAGRRRDARRPIVFGLLGGQGAGKTTFSRLMVPLLEAQGLRCLSLSIDDFYRSAADRAALRAEDPRFRWRGPPGTHDVGLAIGVLDDLRAGRPARVPRFDKSLGGGDGDRAGFEPAAGVDLVIFEGWLVGCRPVPPERLDGAPWPVVTEDERAFARACNERLGEYLPLWDRLDGLALLWQPDFRQGQAWRREAEWRMRSAGGDGMDPAEVDAFVEYFWKALHPDLFARPLADAPGGADVVAVLDDRRQVVAIRRPGAADPETRDLP